ncbi:MAG TPA: hypothetical protein VHE54_04635 [Puia sp.]|nr:hypothetical protein [Puia sp.]
MIKVLLPAILLAATLQPASAEQLYINSKSGNDANPGTRSEPLKTIAEAARRVNANKAPGPSTVFLSAGVYPLTETVRFSNDKYTAQNRLMLRAEVLPGDTGWTPQRMPIIVSVIPTVLEPLGDEMSRGLDIETSHVTIEGLRFGGSQSYYYIDGKHNRCYYPIWREGKTLDDLLVTQCLFAGDMDVLPIRVAVIANGHGLVLDHCVFYHCQNPVVFWEAEGGTSHRDAMRYCLVYGCYYTGVWTTKSTGEDFEFHHNIIAGCRTGWMRENSHPFAVHDCILTDNSNPVGIGNDAAPGTTPSAADFLQMPNVQTAGTITIEKDQGRNNYLQVKEGSFGSELRAGLFR